MRLATTYPEPGGWYYEWCSRADTPEEAAACIYPDVGCIHQGYNVKAVRVGADGVAVTLTEDQARAETLARATEFLEQELARRAPAWEAERVQKARQRNATA